MIFTKFSTFWAQGVYFSGLKRIIRYKWTVGFRCRRLPPGKSAGRGLKPLLIRLRRIRRDVLRRQPVCRATEIL